MQANAPEGGAATEGGGALTRGGGAVVAPAGPTLEEQQQTARKRLLSETDGGGRSGGGSQKRRRWRGRHGGGDGGASPPSPSGSGSEAGEEDPNRSSSPLLLVPQPGLDCGTSAAQQLQRELGGGRSLPSNSPGSGTQPGAPAPPRPQAGSPGCDGSGGTQEQPVPAGALGGGVAASGWHHAALDPSAPGSGPSALAQINRSEQAPATQAGHHPARGGGGGEPAAGAADGGGQPSSRLGTLKRDRSPSPSNGEASSRCLLGCVFPACCLQARARRQSVRPVLRQPQPRRFLFRCRPSL
jgi:hypothetical protein